MLKVRRLTDEERKEKETRTVVKVKDTGMFYLACDKCGVAYTGDDEVIALSTGGYICPKQVKNVLGAKWMFGKSGICENRIYGGDKKSLNQFYETLDP